MAVYEPGDFFQYGDAVKPCPAISKDLLQFLSALYPDRCARRGESMEDIMYAAGQRSVIIYLIERYREQQDNVFDT
jgi:hypothetical protein